MHILFAGGGTAGHINPALAIAGVIKQKHPDAKISYIGTAKKLEAKLVPAAGYDFYTIDVAGFQRKLTPKNVVRNISAVAKAVTASVKSKKLLKKLKPDVVIGTGGYVSGPVLKQAQKLGIKTAIHEQNAFPGITTKMLAAGADCVMLAFPEAEKHLKLNKKPVITGNPVRKELLDVEKNEARKKLGIGDKPLILSFGGSLGARPINEAVTELIKWHNPSGNFYHIHATGKTGYDTMCENLSDITLNDKISIKEYIYDMDVCMAAADLVIGRAGAITLSEISACGKAAILIPSPYVSENHQYHNAMTLKNVGAAEVIEEKYLTGDKLIDTVKTLCNDKLTLKTMAENAKKNAITDANERIYVQVMELYKNSK
ncbi:MAG: undecaprenyldiphospho-muramoylpentapeptide beta-N-acetylglucosaminyltransferase [Clostridia bacterium]|nr:undecaprenyldiphospho-muramoylpentapeptide beta-N-acetylglucosaminyltransferase [Oscillospiraceae bacterium]MBQ2746682.1 undecaprenyldiphospho-muramoylpentapeptide beta-N-acetylglucosaminyltransferase [Clostridia bacterium]